MAPTSEIAVGIELIDRDPSTGESQDWISAESYESATPAQWDDVPICYFRRSGENRLALSKEDFEQSLTRQLSSNPAEGSTLVTVSPLDLSVRTDGLYLWSPSTSKGIRIPIGAIATYAPHRLDFPAPSSSSSSSSPSSPTEVLRLDLIPETDTNDDGGDEDGFSPSVLYHIAVAASPADAAELSSGSREHVDANCSPALQAVLLAIRSCQEHLPAPEDEEMQPRLMQGGVLGGVGGGGGIGDSGVGGGDAVRIQGLENFGGWVTAENVDEVMRAQGITNGADGAEAAHGGGEGLGPGAGSRRLRADGDVEGDQQGERITIWQRTEDA